MRDLWRKTAELLSRNPILWAPYICAELCTSGLTNLRRVGKIAIFHWLTTTRSQSVLGGTFAATTSNAATMQSVARLNSALVWAIHYVNICIDTSALVVTAVLVVMILHQQRPSMLAITKNLINYPGKILFYCLKYLLVMLIFYCVLFLITNNHLITPILHRNGPASFVLSTGFSLLDIFCFAWVIAPITVQLLRPAGSSAASSTSTKLARYSFILAGTATILLGRAIDPLFMKLISGLLTGPAVTFTLASLVSDVPYLFLYIVLALLANEASLECGEPRESKLREILRPLMPLHFQQRKEP